MADSATTSSSSESAVTVVDASQVNTANPTTLSPDAVKQSAQSGASNIGTFLSDVAGQVQEGIGALANKFSNLINLGNIFQAIKGLTSLVTIPGSPPYPNVLHNYASYNYIFTLSVIDDFALAFPDLTYRMGVFGPIILKSGSGDPENRVMTPYGKFDFYIDNLSLKGIVGFTNEAGNTNSVNLRFKVIEPYSMGLFFNSLQQAAAQSGHANYAECPLLLSIEFKGHLNVAEQGISADSLSIENTTKHIPIRILTMEMTVTGRGAEYEITAIPWNERAFSQVVSELKTEISISGKTVHEMLQTGKDSLQRALKEREAKAAEREKRAPNQILISFPGDIATDPSGAGSEPEDDSGATASPVASAASSAAASINKKLGVSIKENGNGTLVQDVAGMNPIGRASMGFDLYKKGDTPFSKDNLAYDSETNTYSRGNITIDPNNGNMRFAQGDNIVNVINQVILMSDYGRQALKSSQVSPTNKITWWRIEPQYYNIPADENIAITGSKPKLIVYRIVPYGVDASTFAPPNTPHNKIEALKAQAIKEYNYIYTSKNLDILKFDINFKAGFFQALTADVNRNNIGTDLAKQSGDAAADQNPESKAPEAGNKEQLPGDITMNRFASAINTIFGNRGGGGQDTPHTMAARSFMDVAVNGVDMLSLDMTILGDPYFIGDSGLGNYTAQQTNLENMTADHSINYQNGEVHVIVNFRTPIDIDVARGAYDFGPTELINEFSGVYRVLKVESNFSRGRFTQNLTLNRLPGQTGKPSDAIASAVTSATTALKSVLSQSAETTTPGEYGSKLEYDGEKNAEIDP